MQSSTSHSLHDSSLIPRNIPNDFPPLPKCFLHLLHCNSENLVKEEPIHAKSAIDQDLGPGHVDSKSTVFKLDSTGSQLKSESVRKDAINSFCSQNVEDRVDYTDQDENRPSSATEQTDACPDAGKRKLLGRLNSSLSKLKKEMTDLRTLDVSLFFQLLSLHEAIQDFKMSVGDRFSETGSEYSLGSASYMGSLSSLSEEDTEWLEGLQSHSSAKSLEDSQVFEHSQSASSLLDQITALVKKADDDF